MSRTSYTFGVLRYFHDVVTGEFANVGIIVYSPALGLRARCLGRYRRITRFFDGAEGPNLVRELRAIERTANKYARPEDQPLLLEGIDAETIEAVVRRFLPQDDSALQFEFIGAGLAESLEQALEQQFGRHVTRYLREEKTESRSDDEVRSVFRRVLQERKLIQHVNSKVIKAPLYQHEFPFAWKNGNWNTGEAVSFDLVQQGSILEKANTWVGRLHSLSESEEPFTVHLLLGRPSHKGLDKTYENAVRILKSAPLEPKLYDEGEPELFAEALARDMGPTEG